MDQAAYYAEHNKEMPPDEVLSRFNVRLVHMYEVSKKSHLRLKSESFTLPACAALQQNAKWIPAELMQQARRYALRLCIPNTSHPALWHSEGHSKAEAKRHAAQRYVDRYFKNAKSAFKTRFQGSM